MARHGLFRRRGTAFLLALIWTNLPTAEPAQEETNFEVASVKPNAGGGGRGAWGLVPAGDLALKIRPLAVLYR